MNRNDELIRIISYNHNDCLHNTNTQDKEDCEKLTDKFLTRQHKQIDSLEKNLNEMRSTYVEGSNNLAKCQTNLHHEVVHKNECEAKIDNYYNTAVGYYNYAKDIEEKVLNHNAENKEKKITFQEIPELPYDKKK